MHALPSPAVPERRPETIKCRTMLLCQPVAFGQNTAKSPETSLERSSGGLLLAALMYFPGVVNSATASASSTSEESVALFIESVSFGVDCRH